MTEKTWFYTGGEYYNLDGKTFLEGQMYVEKYMPATQTRRYPIVMIHGGVQTGSGFAATADGRQGWAGDFTDAGYVVYVIDQPERGRSGHRLTGDATAPVQRYSVEQIQRIFTAPARDRRWPRAHRHSQWPGSGLRGDPLFDNFFASQVEMLADRTQIERSCRDAMVALLDRIGAAIVLTHSQSGPIGWLLADARPQLVKGILAIEPNGPPFRDVQFNGAPDWFSYQQGDARRWGITRLPMTFDPPVDDPEQLQPKLSAAPDDNKSRNDERETERVRGLLPGGPARTLPNLAGIPIAIVSAEASFHACYDQCTSQFLHWAGVDHDYIRLEENGIAGNGHMLMLEKNSDEIATFLIDWLTAAKL